MELLGRRTRNGERSCTGILEVNGACECCTLEDPVRDLGANGEGKIYGKTAIPAGRYRVINDFSPKFQKNMVHILDVPFFTGIRIHSLNDADDTLGCIGVGQVLDGPDHIRGGSVAMPRLQAKIQKALDSGEEVWIEIVNDFPEGLR